MALSSLYGGMCLGPVNTAAVHALAYPLGGEEGNSVEETAQRGLERMIEISINCKIPQHTSELGVSEDAIPRLAKGAMTVTRLLVNNPREMTEEAARAIYRAAY